MAKYRKKPVVIEAFQMTKARRLNNSEWPNWLHEAWQKEYWEVGSVSPEDLPNSDGTDKLIICSPGGFVKRLDWDDWIIQGVEGELYPCHPDLFQKTYEPADTPSW